MENLVMEMRLPEMEMPIVKSPPIRIVVAECQVIGGKTTHPQAAVVVSSGTSSSRVSVSGVGPFEALFGAIRKGAEEFFPALSGLEVELSKWKIVPDEPRPDAVGNVYVSIKTSALSDRSFFGRAADRDTIQATADAYAEALSWLVSALDKTRTLNK